MVTITAPAEQDGKPFARWKVEAGDITLAEETARQTAALEEEMQRVGCDAGKLAEVYGKKQETETALQEQMARWEELSLQLEE